MFNRASIADAYRAITERVKKDILITPDERIIDSDTENLMGQFYDRNHYDPVVIDASRTETIAHQKELRRVPADRREDFYSSMGDTEFEYETIIVTIPLIPNDEIDEIVGFRPSTFSMGWSPDNAAWNRDNVKISIDIKGYGFKHDDQQIKSNVDFQKSRVYEWVNWVGADIRKENETLQNVIRRLVGERKQKLEGDKGRVSALSGLLGIPEAASIVQAVSKPQKVLKIAPLDNQNILADEEYDVFISYASEDREFADKLAKAFRKEGIKSWFDGFEVKWGDDLRSTIDRGLIACKFGVVVFSRSYLSKKRWTEYELNGLFAKEKDKKVVLPVWHEITREDVTHYSPQLADRVAKKSSQIEEIILELKELLSKESKQ
jgi:hypothetical protein